MKILNIKLFKKYRNSPIRFKMMFPDWIGIAEGFPIISFKHSDFKEVRTYFPIGNYKKIDGKIPK